MRILFAISLVALAALLWASVSIAQHIYRSRKQQDELRKPGSDKGSVPIPQQQRAARPPSTVVRDQNTQPRKAS